MRTGFKIVTVLLIVVVATGCTAMKKRRSEARKAPLSEMNFDAVINIIKEYNITDGGLVLKKGRIYLNSTETEGEFGVTAKLNDKGDLIASVKGPLGIEILRILMVGNDICGISRLNRTVYIGKKDEVIKKHGLPEDFMRIIFGDMPDIYYESKDSISSNTVVLKDESEAFAREVSVCLDEMKVCSEGIYSFASKKELVFKFGNFITEAGRKYASEINIMTKDESFHVKLNIEEMEQGFTGEIAFNLPSYKRENL